MTKHVTIVYCITAIALLAVGLFQGWSIALNIFNLCIISAITALGVNIQWGYAGLFNVGVMGFTALGALTVVLVSMPKVQQAWLVAGNGLALSFLSLIAIVFFIILVRSLLPLTSRFRLPATIALLVIGYLLIGHFFLPTTKKIESINPILSGYLGGMGLPVLLSWPIAGMVAGLAAWLIGKVSLGLRADYLAIATLGISDIIIAIVKYEEWLSRGVRNVTGIPRPVPYEVNLVDLSWFISLTHFLGIIDINNAASLFVKLCYSILFVTVLAIILWFSEMALKSPWGRMMRAIRDNRDAAEAMGKDVNARYLQVFILGCAICGVAGAMLATFEGQLTPASYIPLRFTFLIWVMVILGGSGNNWGAILGGVIIWFLWVEVEPMGNWFMSIITINLSKNSAIATHLIAGASYTRYLLMGIILLLVMRFAPKGIIPAR
ncbi:branched-chain amino acid transport system / permease component family protein [Candidatus Endolissoclinum faulkneri L2]|uniref:Branched-chain amino acid transport system / permease component family protein n=1 Tax=Candidatus Endolissoclinum faulkneri L2 TaxID=1193729 RepID=K7ZCX9_9PROT|nr:branched-chain amino acid ABC transporter permease [Candidatus Endolissoclinum faulkneri]AFX98981.1 branched-chain amino acid transport system / permease component family protein [Candidatus Endolissoclinum faulkneri L2]